MAGSVKILGAASAIVLVLASMPGPAGAGDPVADGKKRADACVGCHGRAGVSPYPNIPNLAGQNRGYLVDQLKDLRRLVAQTPQPAAREVPNPDTVMCRLADLLTDRDIDNLAAYYASLPCPPPASPVAVAPPPGSERCADCHGAAAPDNAGDVPYIAGQKQAYLESQLLAYRGARPNIAEPEHRRERHHPSMEPQTKATGIFDIEALARYFAAQSCR